MNKRFELKRTLRALAVGGALASAALLTSCNGMARAPRPPGVAAGCTMPQTLLLDQAVGEVRSALSNGCNFRFDAYFDQLLTIAEGDPQPGNAQVFSELLVWAGDHGVISRRQARETYTRYFGTKFVSAMGDYNTCAQTCPVKQRVVTGCRRSCVTKERGMVKVMDNLAGYQAADQLYQKMELLITATCETCAPRHAGL
jgi:hypothetical protein